MMGSEESRQPLGLSPLAHTEIYRFKNVFWQSRLMLQRFTMAIMLDIMHLKMIRATHYKHSFGSKGFAPSYSSHLCGAAIACLFCTSY